MKVVGIIPSRFASTRLPAKALANLGGKSLIRRVYENALTFPLDDLYIATDDQRIAKEVSDVGGKVILTSDEINSGTERVAQAYATLKLEFDVVVNIQGDEPFTRSDDIEKLIRLFENPSVEIGSLAHQIQDINDLNRDSVIKIVLNKNNEALYFSRAAIPFQRDVKQSDWLMKANYLKHIGIYAFRGSSLENIVSTAGSQLENTEKLEQLSWLYAGFKIKLAISNSDYFSIDTPFDLEKANKLIQEISYNRHD